jgi:hypothetical protein
LEFRFEGPASALAFLALTSGPYVVRPAVRDPRCVAIHTITNDSGAEQYETYTGSVRDSVLAETRAAAEAVGLLLAGVDVITPDPTRPLREVGG